MSRGTVMSERDMRQAVSELLVDEGCDGTAADDIVRTMDENDLFNSLVEGGHEVFDMVGE